MSSKRGRKKVCSLFAALALLLAVTHVPAQEEEPEAPLYTPSKYRIIRVHLPQIKGGRQAAVSRGYYIVNFGSREGVQRGSVFSVRSEGALMGVVRVEEVWRDSAAVRLIHLEDKVDPQSPNPLERGYYLEPRFVFLETIYFDKGEPDFSADMHERLHYAARFVRAYPNFPLVLEGHADNAGKKEENQKLSEERAEKIRLFLHEVHRLPATQIYTKGYGETEPIATNSTEEGRRRNRRVDIILTDERP